MRQLTRLVRYVFPFLLQLVVGVVLLAGVGFLEAFRLILLKPVLVTKDNIKTTVVKDGFQTLKDINQGLPKDEQIN